MIDRLILSAVLGAVGLAMACIPRARHSLITQAHVARCKQKRNP
jgi:hypothetical protein